MCSDTTMDYVWFLPQRGIWFQIDLRFKMKLMHQDADCRCFVRGWCLGPEIAYAMQYALCYIRCIMCNMLYAHGI